MTKSCLNVTYESLLGIPQQVFNLFVEYFGEDRVDLQNIFSEEELSYIITNFIRFRDPSTPITYQEIKETFTLDTYVEKDILFKREDSTYGVTNIFLSYIAEEEFVIMIHYPTLTITNEFDKSHTANNVYVKVRVNYEGMGGNFTINKSTYTRGEFNRRYVHSHVPSFSINHMEDFRPPCLGSGPIRRTITLLQIDADMDLWQLYIIELDNFMQTESIKGIPYIKLESLGDNGMKQKQQSEHYDVLNLAGNSYIETKTHKLLTDFQTYFISKKILKFNYVNNNYGIALSMKDLTLLLSNEFISWYNKIQENAEIRTLYPTVDNLFTWNIINHAKIIDNNISYLEQISTDSDQIQSGNYLFRFKGEPVYLNVLLDNVNNTDNDLYLLSNKVVQWILRNILFLANYNYDTTNSRLSPRNTSVTTPKRVAII